MFVFQREATHPCRSPLGGFLLLNTVHTSKLSPKAHGKEERIVFEMKLTEDRVTDEGSQWTVSAKKKKKPNQNQQHLQPVTSQRY